MTYILKQLSALVIILLLPLSLAAQKRSDERGRIFSEHINEMVRCLESHNRDYEKCGYVTQSLAKVDSSTCLLGILENIPHLNNAGLLALEEMMDKSMPECGGDYLFLYFYSVIFYDALQFEKSIDIYSRMLKLLNDSDTADKVDVLSNRASCHLSLRNYRAAYSDLKMASMYDPDNTAVLNNLAHACLELGQEDEAVSLLKRAISSAPGEVYGYINMGHYFQERARYDSAIYYYDISFQKTDDKAFRGRIFSNYAHTLYLSGQDIKKASRYADSAIYLEPGNAYAYYTKALILENMGQTDLICTYIEAAQALRFKDRFGDDIEALGKKYCYKD